MMTVTTQPAALPIQLDMSSAVTGGVPTADMFGGIVAALATADTASAEQSGESFALAAVPVEGAVAPVVEAERAADADQLLALTNAMPARLQLLVHKPGATVEADVSREDGEPAGEAEQPGDETASQSNPPVALSLPVGIPTPPTRVAATSIRGPATSSAAVVDFTQPREALIRQAVQPMALEPGPAEAKTIAVGIARLLQTNIPEPVRQALGGALAPTKPPSATPAANDGAEPALAAEIKSVASLFTPTAIVASEIAPRATSGFDIPFAVQPDTGELIIERQLDLASGDEWLDDLARDIARTASDGAPLRFRLNPENLGSLRVEIAADRGGTAVRLTADTEAARAIIADAQPRLIAEARAQGLRISEAHVDLGQQPGSGDPRRPGEAEQQPPIRTARSLQEQEECDGKPTARGSERYA